MAEIPSIAFEARGDIPFIGAKVAILVGNRLVTILRDDLADIPWPNHWDLAGGGREGAESPWTCAAREAKEEVSLSLEQQDVVWAKPYNMDNGARAWFFVARVSESRESELALGNEGQQLALVSIDDFLCNDQAVPQFQKRLADWIAACF